MDDHLRKIKVELPKLPRVTWTPSAHMKHIAKGIGIMWGIALALAVVVAIFHYIGVGAGIAAVVFCFLTLIGLAMGHDMYINEEARHGRYR